MTTTQVLRFSAYGLALLAGCASESAQPTAASSSASLAVSAPANIASAQAVTTAHRLQGSPAREAAKAPTQAQKKALLKHLAEGRKLSKSKDFKAAIKELEAALVASPRDARVLAEIGWAAFGDKNLERAKSATTQALASANDAKLRAQILYTRGRAAEEAGDKEAAKKDYAESLTLRDNADVAKHFAAVGGKPEEIVQLWSTCSEGYATTAELCSCLKKNAGSFLIAGTRVSCSAEPKADLGDARLSVVRVTNDDGLVDSAFILVAEDEKKLRAVAMLGEEYDPGAFGVHNTFELKGSKKLAKGAIVAIRHLEDHVDMNMAGLEVCNETLEADTLCVLGKAGSPTVCPRTLPVEISSGCGPGVEPDPADLDPDTAAMVKAIKDNATQSTLKASWAVDDAGKLSVKVTEGDRALYPKALLTEVALLSGR